MFTVVASLARRVSRLESSDTTRPRGDYVSAILCYRCTRRAGDVCKSPCLTTDILGLLGPHTIPCVQPVLHMPYP